MNIRDIWKCLYTCEFLMINYMLYRKCYDEKCWIWYIYILKEWHCNWYWNCNDWTLFITKEMLLTVYPRHWKFQWSVGVWTFGPYYRVWSLYQSQHPFKVQWIDLRVISVNRPSGHTSEWLANEPPTKPRSIQCFPGAVS